MPSAIGHAFAATGIGYVINKPVKRYYWFIYILIAIIPDFDVLAFKMGIPYAHPYGHRGFFHSILFAAIISLLFTLVLRYKDKLKNIQSVHLFITLLIIAASHPLLDALTNGGLGIGLFIPFDNERYFYHIRPIAVSPIGIKAFLGEWGLRVLKSEARWIYFPSCSIIILLSLVSRAKRIIFKPTPANLD